MAESDLAIRGTSALIDHLLKQGQLWGICESFIREQQIGCAETIYQTDRVMENAAELIERICEIIGYYKEPDEALADTETQHGP